MIIKVKDFIENINNYLDRDWNYIEVNNEGYKLKDIKDDTIILENLSNNSELILSKSDTIKLSDYCSANYVLQKLKYSDSNSVLINFDKVLSIKTGKNFLDTPVLYLSFKTHNNGKVEVNLQPRFYPYVNDINKLGNLILKYFSAYITKPFIFFK